MKTKKRLLGILLSLMMVLGLMPGMSMTAYADGHPDATIEPADAGTVQKEDVGNNDMKYTATPNDGYTFKEWEYVYRGYTFTSTSNPITFGSGNTSVKAVFIPIHIHSFTYSASDATITATCNGAGTCDITEGLTLTISAPTGNLVYDGTTTYPAALSTGYNTTAFPGTYSISYTKDGSAYSGVPKDAGTYTASVTAGTGDAAKTASVSYTVTKAAATVTKAPTAKSLTYTGSAQELVTAGEASGGTMQYAMGTDATTAPTTGYTTSIPAKTDAGTYYVWYKAVGNDNYSDSDANCVTVKIAEKDDEISAKPEYKNTSGAGSTWTAGSTEVPTFTFKRTENDETTYDHCTGVMVDGKAVDKANYTKEKGSVIIKLKSTFLDTLAAGEHTLTAMFDDGDDVTVKFTVAAKAADVETKTTEAKTTETKKTDSPKTGDNSNIPLAFMLMLYSAMAAIYLTLRRREEK